MEGTSAVIFVTRNADCSPWQINLLKSICGQKPIPVVLLQSCAPYDLLRVDQGQFSVPSLASFEFTPPALEAAVGVIFGGEGKSACVCWSSDWIVAKGICVLARGKLLLAVKVFIGRKRGATQPYLFGSDVPSLVFLQLSRLHYTSDPFTVLGGCIAVYTSLIFGSCFTTCVFYQALFEHEENIIWSGQGQGCQGHARFKRDRNQWWANCSPRSMPINQSIMSLLIINLYRTTRSTCMPTITNSNSV
jgi:hypothetical protein